MTALRFAALLLIVALSGCSLLHSDDPAQAQSAPPKKKASFWPLGNHAPQEATAYLEYQRAHTEADKSSYALFVRNTHLNKAIEGDIRTTIETGPGESKVDTMHFALAPNETKKLLVYPKTTQMTYEVTAFFKE
jgi:hypothetical protein